MSDTFPLAAEALQATMVELLMARGMAHDAAILASSEADVVQTGFDNWDGGTRIWQFNVKLPAAAFGLLSVERVRAFEETATEVSKEMLRTHPRNWIAVVLCPLVHARADWREQAVHWLNGSGVTNQGRVRSDNIAARQEDGLLFRSQPEVMLYRALKETSVPFAPLPVFLHGGRTYQRIEPDFVLLKDRVVLVVEVDGDTVHRELPAQADQRLRMLKHEGVVIERVFASECDTPERARACAERLVGLIEKVKGQR